MGFEGRGGDWVDSASPSTQSMATLAQQYPATTLNKRNSPTHVMENRNSPPSRDVAPPPVEQYPGGAKPPGKKGKARREPESTEAAKLKEQKQIQAKIAQLELDAAGDKEQEAEIGAFSPAHTGYRL